jgi:hypothetical protein
MSVLGTAPYVTTAYASVVLLGSVAVALGVVKLLRVGVIVRERRALVDVIRSRGGAVFYATDYGDDFYRQFRLPLTRTWLGDAYVMQITLPADATDAEIKQLQTQFPECFVYPPQNGPTPDQSL